MIRAWLASHRLSLRAQRRLADGLYALLLIALVLLIGWLSARYNPYLDWTQRGEHTLSAESLALVAELNEPLLIRVFISEQHRLVQRIEQVLLPYRQAASTIRIEYIDPERHPELARDFEVKRLGQLVLAYRGRYETLTTLNQTTLTNAIARLTLDQSPWIAVLEGHGERAIDSGASTDLGQFAAVLEGRGFRLQPIDLARFYQIPDNTDVLLLTTPTIALFPGEIEAIIDYVAQGGNVLWLLDPGELRGFAPLADVLGLLPLPGQVVDASARRFGAATPTVAVVSDWPAHPLGGGAASTDPTPAAALFPGALAFEPVAAPDWEIEAQLRTSEHSWNETGAITGTIERNPERGEQAGPLTIGLALTRPFPLPDQPQRQQRILVLGDGDFLSNAALHHGGNRAFGLRMMYWLAGLDALQPFSEPETASMRLTLTRGLIIAFGGLVVIPVGLIVIGMRLRFQRGRMQ